MKIKFGTLFLVCIFLLSMMPQITAVEDTNNGNWNDRYVTLRNTSEAELMVRVGDIDNVGYGFPTGYDPFNEENYSAHTYPWETDPLEPAGTDRIMLGSSINGDDLRDGYSQYFRSNPDSTRVRSIVMNYDTSGIVMQNALLQIYIDDFQAPLWGSNFVVTLNGKNAPFIAELINSVTQTGPIANIISAEVPSAFFSDIISGRLELFIDDPTTGVGDGYAVDFVKLLINYKQFKPKGTIKGLVLDKTTSAPIIGSTIRVLGTGTTTVTDANGRFEVMVYPGINNIRVSKSGYTETYTNGIVSSDEIVDYGTIYLTQGTSTPDIDHYTGDTTTIIPQNNTTGTTDGNWSDIYVTTRNSPEAELIVRVGDIDNVGYGFPEGFDPFNEANYSSHTYPWEPNNIDPPGTDRIMLGSSFEGIEYRDGYSQYHKINPSSTLVRSINMNYDTTGIIVNNALLQIYIDDFQAPLWGSSFTATINGKDAPFITELINSVNQTGPIANIISAEIPYYLYSDVKSGSLEIFIDDSTTKLGDGFAIDFVRLLVNYTKIQPMGVIKGNVIDGNTNRPLYGAAIRILGTNNTTLSDIYGNFELFAYPGINNLRIGKVNYEETYVNGVVSSNKTSDYGVVKLYEGEGTPDFNPYLDTTPFESPEISFTDLPLDHWAHNYVQHMVDLGIINGYPDGTFRPNAIFSRSAFAKLLALSFELPDYTGNDIEYEDLPIGHWAYDYVMNANAYLTSFEKPDGTKIFSPNGDAVREDVAVAMIKAIGLDPTKADLSLLDNYLDSNDISLNLRNYVALAIEYGVMQGANNMFRPQEPLTRAEASTLFARFLMEIKGTLDENDLIKVTN